MVDARTVDEGTANSRRQSLLLVVAFILGITGLPLAIWLDLRALSESTLTEQANDIGLNLVEVSPNADPPVCKFLDVGKHRYEAQKKANAARKTQKTQQIKEIKMRPNIDDHDYDVKMRSVTKFIEEGDKVKMTLRFRGREMAHQELGMDLLKRVQDDVAEIAKIEAYPRLEGRQMLMVLAPK